MCVECNTILNVKQLGNQSKEVTKGSHHVSKYYCQLVDLEDKQPLVQPLILLQRNFGDYAKDQDMELVVKKKSSIMEWEFHPVYL